MKALLLAGIGALVATAPATAQTMDHSMMPGMSIVLKILSFPEPEAWKEDEILPNGFLHFQHTLKTPMFLS